MDANNDYLKLNRASWNERVTPHLASDFYDMPAFLAGKSSLNSIELDLLGDVNEKRILHLQCHFGQDSLSLARMGAKVTGIDLSDQAIAKARELNEQLQLDAEFICCDVYDTPNHVHEKFDIVFTSYGTIGWLPDLDQWAQVIQQCLAPGGKLVFAEFHPVVWMFDDDFERVAYRYFKDEAIVETQNGTYADKDANIEITSVTWNHGLAEVLGALLNNGLHLEVFNEFDYSPYPCFRKVNEIAPGKFVIPHLGNNIPMVYALVVRKR